MNMPAGEFKAKCLRIMDEVHKNREEVIITKHGKPVAKLVPVDESDAAPVFGWQKGAARVLGDIVNPIDEEWDAEN